ncbi:MAG: hypothetical protein LBU88_08705 [Treponema sp.]|nr:hypothetical protein [Treponema sp.]
MKNLGLVFLAVLMLAGFFSPALYGQVLTLDQTGLPNEFKAAGGGIITGAVLDRIKTIPVIF